MKFYGCRFNNHSDSVPLTDIIQAFYAATGDSLRFIKCPLSSFDLPTSTFVIIETRDPQVLFPSNLSLGGSRVLFNPK